MAEKTEKSEKPATKPVKIFDVSKPGKQTPAMSTARPVIVTNRPIMHDPMMTAPTTDEQPTSKLRTPSSSKLVIKPIDEDGDGVIEEAAKPSGNSIGAPNLPIDEIGKKKPEPAKEEPTPEEPKPELQPEEEPAAPEPESEPEPEKKKDEPKPEPKPEPTPDPEPITVTSSVPDDVNVPAGNESTTSAKEAAKADAEQKKQDEINKLIAEKTYFLPLNAVKLRRSRRDTIAGVILAIVLSAALIVLLMDIGIVTIPGIEAPTAFF